MDRQVSTEENKGCSKKKTLKRKLVFMVVAFVKKKSSKLRKCLISAEIFELENFICEEWTSFYG
jgi:hypothetical protein